MNNYLCTGYLHRMATLWTLLLCVCMHSQPAQATTEAEDQHNRVAMPHELLGVHGAMVKVHLTSLRGYFEGQPDNATSLARMRTQVSDCVRDHQKGGPPPRTVRLSKAEIAAAERAAASNPAMAALVAVMHQHPQRGTGEHKTILGLECEVYPAAIVPNGTVCLSLGGAFIAAHAASGLTESSMELEMTAKVGIKMRATVAKLDAMVDAAVFAPYQAGAISVKEIGTRP